MFMFVGPLRVAAPVLRKALDARALPGIFIARSQHTPQGTLLVVESTSFQRMRQFTARGRTGIVDKPAFSTGHFA